MSMYHPTYRHEIYGTNFPYYIKIVMRRVFADGVVDKTVWAGFKYKKIFLYKMKPPKACDILDR